MVIFGILILIGSGVAFAQESEDISIIFDQDQYTWTDKVKVTIIAPDYNKSEGKIDMIGESGTVLTISTKNHLITKFPMKETDPNTGIFSKEIILTGFAHDADGNSQTGDKDGNDVLGLDYVSEGAAIGDFLSSDDDDTILVKFTAMEQGIEKYSVEKTVPVMWNVGELQFERKSYSDNDVAKILVKDPDMNWNPKKIDGFVIDVWSDSYFAGVKVNMSETDINTGIFEGTIVLSTKNLSEDKLFVVEGDSVTAEYEDNTLPNPYSPADEINIKDRTIIRNPPVFSDNIAPLKQLKMGVQTSEIQCRENFVLILKYDLTPACVSEKTQNQLILRNWAHQETIGNIDLSSNEDSIKQISN